MQRAASLMVIREPEVLLVLRGAGTLLDGTWAFPGGGITDDDRAPAASVEGRGLDPEDRAGRLAALREAFEETGLLFVPGAARISPERWEDHRATLLAGRTTLPEILALEHLRVDLAALAPAGRFVLDGFVSPALEVGLYVLRATEPPGGRASLRRGEVAQIAWMRPEALVERWAQGRAAVTPSVLSPLRALAGLPENAAPAFELVRGILMVPLEAPTLPPATHTNCFIVGTGAERIVVDPGSPWEAPAAELDGVLDTLEGQGARVREIWLTHAHPDHVGGARRLRTRLGVPVRAHALTARLLGTGLVDGLLEDGETVLLPGDPEQHWLAVHTPGHHPGHLAFYEAGTGALLAGDLVAGVGTVIVDPPEGNMRAYFASLRRVRSLGANTLFPGHGPPSGHPAHHIDAYVMHRQAREDAILAAMIEGARTPADMVARVYTDVAAALHPLAERNVLAHLEKLSEEGRAARTPEGWTLTA